MNAPWPPPGDNRPRGAGGADQGSTLPLAQPGSEPLPYGTQRIGDALPPSAGGVGGGAGGGNPWGPPSPPARPPGGGGRRSLGSRIAGIRFSVLIAVVVVVLLVAGGIVAATFLLGDDTPAAAPPGTGAPVAEAPSPGDAPPPGGDQSDVPVPPADDPPAAGLPDAPPAPGAGPLDAVYLSVAQQAGVPLDGAELRAIGPRICAAFDRGDSGSAVRDAVAADQPELTPAQTAALVGAAVGRYCVQHAGAATG